MTRINAAIPVKCLTDEHLKSEHREIKRICFNFGVRKLKNKFDDIPKRFTLGTGHVIFFIDKPKFTFNRYYELYLECKYRNFNVQNWEKNWDIYDNTRFINNGYTPTERDRDLLIERISGILETSTQQWHYFGHRITVREAKEILQSEEYANNFLEQKNIA